MKDVKEILKRSEELEAELVRKYSNINNYLTAKKQQREENKMKKIMVTGIKPTGQITLGNYLGVIKDLIRYQEEYDLYLFVADLHSLTINIDPVELKENIKNLIYIYFAAGISNKTHLFRQSKIPAHNQLEWILTCNTDLSDLTKMPQYKNYLVKYKDKATPTGMLLYPSLMNADILLYSADYVPVGIDQQPHVELTRDVAEKFNKTYGKTFKLPECVLNDSSKIMSLSDPTKKMSKSESDKGTIYLLDDIEISKKKIMKAVTDSENKVYYDTAKKPGVSNLMMIYSKLSGLSLKDIEEKYKDINNYGTFKKDLANILEAELKELQEKYNLAKALELDTYLEDSEKFVNEVANKKIKEVYKKVGLVC